MPLADSAKEYRTRLFGDRDSVLEKTDPEFAEFFQNFAFGDVVNAPSTDGEDPLDDRTRFLAVLAALIGCQGIDAFVFLLPAAVKAGATPIEVREVVYQSFAYLGFGRAFPFLKAMNAVFDHQLGVKTPLEPQSTTTRENRVEKGNQVQIDYFGEQMREFWKNAPAGRENINLWLAGNCFGDYYTRKPLTDREREMITFCYIAAQGGCEPQLIAHAVGNIRVGSSAGFLRKVVEQLVPWIGYPRSLNALSAIDQAVKQLEQ